MLRERERFFFSPVFSRSAGHGGSMVSLCVFCALLTLSEA